jgi:hypothetical protein
MSSNDCCRPTHTLESSKSGAKVFNATQVRLYGIANYSDISHKEANELHECVTRTRSGKEKEEKNNAKETTAGSSYDTEKLLAGFSAIAIDVKDAGYVGLYAIGTSPTECCPSKELSAGIIYSYAFEGHCYDLPKPKIMLIPAKPKKPTCDDCGYDRKVDCDFRVWVVDKLDRCIEIEVNQGFVEQLVLDANLPGKRSPTAYRAVMALAHRSGRLTE